MSSSRAALFVTLGALSPGCAGAGGCPASAACESVRWLDGLVAVDNRQVLVEATGLAVPGRPVELSRTDALPISSRAVVLRFDPSRLRGVVGIERAVLALSPHPSWRPGARASRLVVRGLRADWQPDRIAAGDAPSPSEHLAMAPLPAGLRAPLRVDVTAAVQSWLSDPSPAPCLSLETDGADAVFVGTGAALRSARPRLEVVVR